MIQDKISIITASYNYADYISECIESVIAQTYTNWELIVVDDGSTDNSVDIIKSYCLKDKRIKLFQHPNNQNKGLQATLQLGIRMCTSKWIAFLESDDKFMPNYLEEKIKIISKEPEAAFIYNDFKVIGDETYYESTYYKRYEAEILSKNGYIGLNKLMGIANFVPTFSMVMLNKKVLKNLDFNSPIKQWLDYYLWVQISSKIPFYFINKKLTCWRKHDGSYIKSQTSHKFEFAMKLFFRGYPTIVLNKIKLTMLCAGIFF